jgi:hypothetical protein
MNNWIRLIGTPFFREFMLVPLVACSSQCNMITERDRVPALGRIHHHTTAKLLRRHPNLRCIHYTRDEY